MTNRPSVTACLTVYNAETFLGPTLESLTRQTWPALRILISDDHSTDRTPALLEQAAADPRIELLRPPRRLGWVDNTNFLLDRIGTDFFFLCYHDDVLEPSYVEDLMSAIDAGGPGVVGAFCDLALATLDGQLVRRSFAENDDVADPVERGRTIIRMIGFPWVSNRGVYRTSVLRRIGGLRKNLAGEFSAAYPWVLALTLEGEQKRVARVLCHKTLRDTGVSTQWSKTYREYLALYLDFNHSIWRSRLSFEQQDQLLSEVAACCAEILSRSHPAAPFHGRGRDDPVNHAVPARRPWWRRRVNRG